MADRHPEVKEVRQQGEDDNKCDQEHGKRAHPKRDLTIDSPESSWFGDLLG